MIRFPHPTWSASGVSSGNDTDNHFHLICPLIHGKGAVYRRPQILGMDQGSRLDRRDWVRERMCSQSSACPDLVWQVIMFPFEFPTICFPVPL